jgi:hypothetical protein
VTAVAAMVALRLWKVRTHPPNGFHVPATLKRHTPPIELQAIADVGVPPEDQNGRQRVHGANGVENKRPCRVAPTSAKNNTDESYPAQRACAPQGGKNPVHP